MDRERFKRPSEVLALSQRMDLGLPAGAVVLGFIGRLTRDKGVVELYEAWVTVHEQFPELHLLIVGAFESGDPVPDVIRARLEGDKRVHIVGWQADVVPFISMMDVLVLPTYREGFGLVLIEAAAMGIPTVATRIPGCVDAVDDGVTGFLVAVQDGAAVARACEKLLSDEGLRVSMGKAGQRYVADRFEPEPIWAGYYAEYEALVGRQS